ncbi:MAG: MFS transporter [bacterium]
MKQIKFTNLFKNKEFLKLWLGQICSYLGDSIIQIALMSWVISFSQKAGSEMAKILFFFMLPSLLLSPLAGGIADRFSRKWIMVCSNAYRALLVFIIPAFLFKNTIIIADTNFSIYGFSFLMGIGSAFYYPAKQSTLPNIVKSEHLQLANALNSGTATIAILLGAIISGIYINKIGLANGLFLNGFIYIISALFASLLKLGKHTTICVGKCIYNTVFKDFGFTLAYLKKHKKTLRLILLSVALSLITASFFNSMNALATDYFKIGISGVSKLKGMLGVGMILGTLITLYLSKYIRISYLLAGSFLAIFLTTATAQLVKTYSMAWGWLVLIGIANSIILITLDTILQKVTPDRLRGKIFGFRSTVTTGAFLATMWIVSEVLTIKSPINVFKSVSALSFSMALIVLLFDSPFRHFLVRTTFGSIFRVFFPIKIEGREHLKTSGKMILAGNHTGWIDTLILQVACKRPIWFITGEVAFNLPVIRLIINYFNVIAIKPRKGVEALDVAVKKLLKGEVLCIFPEGKLTTDGKLNKFNKGVAYMAKNSNTPIVPFVIHGGFEAWAYNKLFPTFKKITIQFGQPIYNLEDNVVDELKDRVQFMKDSIERKEKIKAAKTDYENVLDLMQFKGDIHGPVKALSLKDKDSWKELSYIELSRQAKNFANYLIANGLERNDKIAILSESRPEWGIALFASIQTGAITVPLDIKLTNAELISILSDCLPKILCVSAHYIETAKELQKNIPSIENIFVIEEKPQSCEFRSVYELKAPQGDIGRDRTLDETALIIYTSGTTGNPKGVMITFGNIIAQLKDFESVFKINSNDSLVSILPLNHLLELNVGFLGMLYMGARVSYCKSLNPKEIGKVMKERQATYMIVVPLFVKMLKNSVEKEIRKSDKTAQNLFEFMYKIAKYMPIHIRRIMFKKVIAGFGGKLKGFVCGGAPLETEVGEFFERIGIPIYQGYGLTETSPSITTNTPEDNRIGSVGKPLPSVIIRLSEEGEILTKGPNLMKGYYNNPQMTAEVIDEEGWFHTGDIGEFDKDGFLYITGRIKNMIVLGGGKKIFPEEVEATLSKNELIKELCVMSVKIKGGAKDGTEEVCAVIVPSDDLVKQYQHNPKELEKIITSEVNKQAKAELASYKCPTVITVNLEELPKTATRKVKRKEVEKWYYQRLNNVGA